MGWIMKVGQNGRKSEKVWIYIYIFCSGFGFESMVFDLF